MRAERRVACVLFGLALAAGATRSSESVAGPPLLNGRIAFTSAWAPDLSPEVYKVDVATGRRTNLTRDDSFDSGGVVSPDGRTILFRRSDADGGSIWAMDADGTAQHRLAAGETPVWSPDGLRIALVQNDAVVIVAADGSDLRRVAPGRLPAWSPDGRTVAFVDGAALVLAGADGSSPRRLWTTTAVFSSPEWSPDGSRIALAAELLLPSGDVVASAVVAVDAHDREARAVTTGAFDTEPVWSPDSARIAFVRGRRILAAAVSGGAPRVLTHPPADRWDGRPAWSPDARTLAFARGSSERDAHEVWVLRGGSERRVRREDVHSRLVPGDRPVWSPDGRSLVYASQLVDNDTDVYTVRPVGGLRKQLTTNDVDDRDPSFSPDGRLIVFVRQIRGDRSDLFVMRADGSGVRRLTRTGGYAPSWSPDGSRIVFVALTRGGVALSTIRPDGGGLRRLRSGGMFWDSPSWSPDGTRIAVTHDSPEGGGIELGGTLVTLAADGRDERPLAELDEGVIAWYPQWSPDGSRVSFARDPCSYSKVCAGIELWTVDADGTHGRALTDASDGAWSPDGKHLVVLDDGRAELRLVSPTGRREALLGAAGGAGAPGLSWQSRCTLAGGPKANRLRGSSGDDVVCGLGGDDRITGGRGRDRLYGEEGDDAIDSRDGGFDVVGCGPGRDVVSADRVDLVGGDCERVARA